ncbi:MAG: lipocalin family protein [Bacteroidales bacterium]|nr:lipocalin family protein [Bacteroidales bacterium]
MKALKFLFVALALLMVAPTFTSCKDDEKDEPGAPQSSASLVGTWVYSEEGFSDTFIFSSNGSYTNSWSEYYNGEWKTGSDYGTYTFDGSTLTLRDSDGYVDSFRITLTGNYFDDGDGWIYFKR